MYNWTDVAARTLEVYDSVTLSSGTTQQHNSDDPTTSSSSSSSPTAPSSSGRDLLVRLARGVRAGPWAGPIWCFALVVYYWWWLFVESWWPADRIEAAPDWPREEVEFGGGGGDGGGTAAAAAAAEWRREMEESVGEGEEDGAGGAQQQQQPKTPSCVWRWGRQPQQQPQQLGDGQPAGGPALRSRQKSTAGRS
jgi:hypothetical protein